MAEKETYVVAMIKTPNLTGSHKTSPIEPIGHVANQYVLSRNKDFNTIDGHEMLLLRSANVNVERCIFSGCSLLNGHGSAIYVGGAFSELLFMQTREVGLR